MLNVQKENKNGKLVVRLIGSIEENVDFPKLIGPAPKEVQVICKQVPRINSDGIRKWVEYFGNLTSAGTKVEFIEVSTALVEQMSLISNFSSGANVVSIYVPYWCEDCKSELIGLFDVSTIKKLKFKIPPVTCSKCGSKKTAFDDIADEYFNFLKK